MTLDQLNKKAAREIIADAMKIFRGPSYVKQSKKVVSSGNYGDLSREQIIQGVVAFVVHLNLSGGSVGTTNLYELLLAYLLDPLAQSDLNEVVARRDV